MSDDKRNTPDQQSAAERPTSDRPANQDRPGEGPVMDAPVVDADAETVRMPEPQDALAAARAEAASLKDQLLRALAETENVRRRAQREREDAQKFGIDGFARDLLPVADNLRRALEAVAPEALANDEALKSLVTGVEMTERQLLAGFEKHGLARIDPMGEKFDSNLHQAMFEVPGSGQPHGTVVQVMQPGYVLNGRLLRAAMVGVAKGEAQGAAKGAAPQPDGDGNPAGGRVDTVA